MPPRHRTPSHHDRAIVERIDQLLDRLRRNVSVVNELEEISDEIEHILGDGASASEMHAALLDLFMRRLTHNGRTVGAAITGRALTRADVDALGVLQSGAELIAREPNPHEKRRMAVEMKSALDMLAPPGRPGRRGRRGVFPVPAALLRDVHHDLRDLLAEARHAHTLPADVWRCGLDRETEPAEAAWRLIAWRLGFVDWRTVRRHARPS